VQSSATSNGQLTASFPQAAIGYKVRIVSGKGAGQEKNNDVNESRVQLEVVSRFTQVQALRRPVRGKSWLTSYTGATGNVNGYAGYMVRLLLGTGLGLTRETIFYPSAQPAVVETSSLLNFYQNDTFAVVYFGL